MANVLLEVRRILFFNVNGSGMGHLNRCLAYAQRSRGRARSLFFSLASANEIIGGMGLEAEYFVSPYWSSSSTFSWNSELAVRFGMTLERVRPDVVVFDGTWPFQGFLSACDGYGGSPAKVWSNRGLLKPGVDVVSVDESWFDLVIQPGELGAVKAESRMSSGGKRVTVPPVCLLDDDELMARAEARAALGLDQAGRYVLFSLGPGNLKDVAGIGLGLIQVFEAQGFEVLWARPPISVRDVELPSGVRPLSVYPLARYLRAFDAFVGAAGYNTCCELVQAGVPALLVPNALVADDQWRRAQAVAELIPAVMSACETDQERREAVDRLLGMMAAGVVGKAAIPMDGASVAAEEILALAERRRSGCLDVSRRLS